MYITVYIDRKNPNLLRIKVGMKIQMLLYTIQRQFFNYHFFLIQATLGH